MSNLNNNFNMNFKSLPAGKLICDNSESKNTFSGGNLNVPFCCFACNLSECEDECIAEVIGVALKNIENCKIKDLMYTNMVKEINGCNGDGVIDLNTLNVCIQDNLEFKKLNSDLIEFWSKTSSIAKELSD